MNKIIRPTITGSPDRARAGPEVRKAIELAEEFPIYETLGYSPAWNNVYIAPNRMNYVDEVRFYKRNLEAQTGLLGAMSIAVCECFRSKGDICEAYEVGLCIGKKERTLREFADMISDWSRVDFERDEKGWLVSSYEDIPSFVNVAFNNNEPIDECRLDCRGGYTGKFHGAAYPMWDCPLGYLDVPIGHEEIAKYLDERMPNLRK